MLEAAAATAAQLEATERSLARAEGAKAVAEQLTKRQARPLLPLTPPLALALTLTLNLQLEGDPSPSPNLDPNPDPNSSPNPDPKQAAAADVLSCKLAEAEAARTFAEEEVAP